MTQIQGDAMTFGMIVGISIPIITTIIIGAIMVVTDACADIFTRW